MVRHWLTFTAVFLAFVVVTTAAPRAALADKRVALVIGNSAYRSAGRLPNPANDATAMGELFKNAGFDDVRVATDLGVSDMRRELRAFSEKAAGADVAVVYYAGHGMEIAGHNYLVPVDAVLAHGLDAEDEAVDLDRVLQLLEPAKRLKLVILDACRNNPFTENMRRVGTSRAIGRGLGQPDVQASDTLVAYAARAGSTALDGDSAHSPFTTALLHHLTTPGLDLRIALGNVHDEVVKASNREQEPFLYGALGGGTLALVPGGTGVGPSQVSEAFCERSAEFDTVINSQGVDMLRAYIQRCGSGGKYRQEAAREFESRLFLAASECIRRAPGCNFDGCVSIYERELPDGTRGQWLRSQAATMAAAKAVCQRASSDDAKHEALQPGVEPLERPEWCAKARGGNPNETLICSDAQLAGLDIQLNTAYRRRLNSLIGDSRGDFVRANAAWVARRDQRCVGVSAERKSCLLADVQARIAYLEGTSEAEETQNFIKPVWCAKARGDNPNESLICSDMQLAQLDNEANELFQSHLRSLAGQSRREFLRAAQDWVANRDQRCDAASSSKRKTCLVLMIRDRINSLRGD